MSTINIALFKVSSNFIKEYQVSENRSELLENVFQLDLGSIFNLSSQIGDDCLSINFECNNLLDVNNFISSKTAKVICGEIFYDEVGETQTVSIYEDRQVGINTLNNLLLENDLSLAFKLSIYRDKIQLFNKTIKQLRELPQTIFGVDILSYVSNNSCQKIKDYILDYCHKNNVNSEIPYDEDLVSNFICEADIDGIRNLKDLGMNLNAEPGQESIYDLFFSYSSDFADICDPVEVFKELIDLGVPISKGNTPYESPLVNIVCFTHLGVWNDDEEPPVYEQHLDRYIAIIELLESQGFDIKADFGGASLRWWARPELKPYLEGRGVDFYSDEKYYESLEDRIYNTIHHMDYEAFDRYLTKELIEVPRRSNVYKEALKVDDYFFKRLVEMGCKPTIEEEITPLLIGENRFDLLKLFIQNNIPTYPTDPNIIGSFENIIENHDVEKLKALQSIGFDCIGAIPCALIQINQETDKLLEIVKIVLDGGSNPNVKFVHYHHETPLSIAKEKGFSKLEVILKEYGANEESELVEMYD